MKRRQFLLAGAALGIQGCGSGYGPLLFNPCLSSLPARLGQHALVREALEGLDAAQLWDGHVHLVGTGDSDSGIWINPRMQGVLHIRQYLQYRFYLNAACAAPEGVDESFLHRLLALHSALPGGAKLLLLAFDFTYTEDGSLRREQSAFHTPNRYAASVAAKNPEQLEWIASIHPYRKDAESAVYAVANKQARAVKWLPPAMGINPGSPLCDPFYAALKENGLPLLVHAGEEKAVHGANRQDLGNPLLLRRPLEQGVKVIVAHCASLGASEDIDSNSGKKTDNFQLFKRMMDEEQYRGLLFGEISAITQVNREVEVLETLLRRQDWHSRLVNASDYPLPAIMPLFSLRKLAGRGYISKAQAELLGDVRAYNALLFDLLLKRMLRVDARRFLDPVFHSRRLFLPAAAGSVPL